MIDLYRVKYLNEQTDVYGIIAGDTSYTMSPYIHNAAFRAKGLSAVFVPFQVADLDAFITRMVRPETREVELNFRGFSVTNPHKQTMIKYLDHIDEAASKIGAVNTIKIVDGRLHGFNTDADGFIKPLKNSHSDLTGAKAAVVGAGGAARACICSLLNEGATPTVFARNTKKANELAKSLGVEIKRLETDWSRPATDFSDFDIVVNTTPLGTRGERVNETVATAEQLSGVKLVYDLVYNPTETRLMQEAKRAGAETLGGFDMLIAQAVRQFEMWTEMPAPVKEMSAAAKKRIYDS
jgi:shikimate dehydrogenase